MLIHVDDLMPDMRLEKDIELSAGSYLITRKELAGGQLTEEVIEKVRRFASQLAPEKDMVFVIGDDLVYKHLKSVLEKDVEKIMRAIETGKDLPNFLAESDLRGKVQRIMEKLVSNPDLLRNMYNLKIQSKGRAKPQEYILEHSIRVTLLGLAVGLKVKMSIISLFNLGVAAVLHDMGILESEIYPRLDKLDDLDSGCLEEFIQEHQRNSERIFTGQQLTMMPHTRNEIEHMLRNHHRPEHGDETHKATLLLYLAELVDEMVTAMPHRVRYNFTQVQKHILGRRYEGRVGLTILLLGLIKLFKGQGLLWEMVQALAKVFSMEELLVENYEEKLKKIIDFCPFRCAVPYPSTGGNALPRTIYCKNSRDKDFYCEHMSQVSIEIQNSKGHLAPFFKCATLNGQLHHLNSEGRKASE
ncbi:MAG: hypothetical protein JXQ83_11990 [Candidatus Glassbacteria bacterium]|nr:hypothetical protein [Candidatus Glassbacteria bacterium]